MNVLSGRSVFALACLIASREIRRDRYEPACEALLPRTRQARSPDYALFLSVSLSPIEQD